MLFRPTLAAVLAAGAFALPGIAAAQSGPGVSTVAPSPDLVFTLGGGAAVQPSYFGSDDYEAAPALSFSLGYINLGPLRFGNPDPLFEPEGLGIRGSFRFIGERDDEDGELEGLDEIDASVEVGFGLGYRSRSFDAFADVRYGVIGHESFVGELGADAKVHPSDALTLTLGPRILIGSDDYVDTYFGVGADEAGASDFAAYDADGGVVSAGLELGMEYRLNENWGVEGAVTWDRFTGDAEDSPIIENGERDQYGIRIGVTRRITLDF